jgi:hypothetical protein
MVVRLEVSKMLPLDPSQVVGVGDNEVEGLVEIHSRCSTSGYSFPLMLIENAI